ncbi:hypothetical protein MYX78_01180 [Acidobacteria bacterium AH-259-G07]|nr:hypothetical protein [Acidobacteria bacterium AH-259-G07]
MKKTEHEEAPWETPSLEWIHRIRRDRQRERGGRPAGPLPHAEAEQLAKRFGLKLTKTTPIRP